MREHGSEMSFTSTEIKAREDGKPRTATSTFTQLLSSDPPVASLSRCLQTAHTREKLDQNRCLFRSHPCRVSLPLLTNSTHKGKAGSEQVFVLLTSLSVATE